MTKVKLFTHNDMDGRGCEVVMRLAYPDADVTIVKNPKDASKKVTEFINSGEYLKYDETFITDISVDAETADLIDEIVHTSHTFVFHLLDHHQTAEFLNEYRWASVQVNMGNSELKNSGTNMLFEYLVMNGFFINESYKDALTVFVEKIRRYDTWEWKEVYSDQEAAELNNLMYLIGTNAWVERYVSRFEKLDLFAVSEGSWLQMFDSVDKTVIEMDNNSKEAYTNRKEKQMIVKNLFGHKLGFVFAEQYISELGNSLSERHPELDYIAMVDMGALRVSLRTTHNHIALGKEVASKFGGGGHAKASGFEFSPNVLDKAFKLIFIKSKLTKIIDKLTGN